MAKRKVNRIEIGGDAGPEGSLTHNPFAALKGAAGSDSSQPSAAKSDRVAPVPGSPPAPTPPRTLSGAGNVVVRHERKGHGGKTVTVADLSRIEVAARPDLKQLAKDAAKKLGTGARVVGDTVVVQGNVVERLDAFLTQAFGAKVVRGTQP